MNAALLCGSGFGRELIDFGISNIHNQASQSSDRSNFGIGNPTAVPVGLRCWIALICMTSTKKVKKVKKVEPRSRKEWLLDVVLFLCAAAYGIVISGLVVTDPAVTPGATLFTL